METKLQKLSELLEVLDKLRENCPWDRKQTNETLRNLTIEECFELCDAIDNKDSENIREELGDLLLHILFYSKIAEQKGEFNIGDVAQYQAQKLKFRHPHIYSDVEVSSVDDVISNWDKLKKIEKGESRKALLSGVPVSLPSLLKAEKIQSKVAKVGFDWEEPVDVFAKVQEELNEVLEAVQNSDRNAIKEELGDLLFAVVNACRLYDISAESALEGCNRKFTHRFNTMEQLAQDNQTPLESLTIQQMEVLWQEAKLIINQTK